MTNCRQPIDNSSFLAEMAAPAKKPKISFGKLLSISRLLKFLK